MMNIDILLKSPFFWALLSMFGLLGAGAVTSSRKMTYPWLAFLGSLLVPLAGFTVLVLPFVKQLRFAGGQWHGYVGGVLLAAAVVLEIAAFLPARQFKEKGAQVRLQVGGFYSVVRHPMYMGAILYALGMAFVFRSVAGVALLPIWLTAFLFLITIEEEIMMERLGETYKEYKRLVPGRLLPRARPVRRKEIVRYPFENLVLKGGGVRGIAYSGAAQVLEERGILPQINRISGASAGAITALMLSFRLSMEETIGLMETLDFSRVPQARSERPTPSPHFWRRELSEITDNLVCTQRLIEDYGWYSTEYFYDWLQIAIAEHCEGNGRATFADFRQRGFRDLYVVAANVSKRRSEMFSAATTPHVAVADAVRMSMSIPLYFRALRFDGQQFGQGDYYVDGGLYDNYPIRYFDDESFNQHNRWYRSRLNWATLGCYLYTPPDCVRAKKEFNHVVDFANTMLQEMALENREQFFTRQTLDVLRTVMISDCCVQHTEFDIPPHSEKYQNLIESGRTATIAYLDAYHLPEL